MKLNFTCFSFLLIAVITAHPSSAQTGWYELGSPIETSYSGKTINCMTRNASGTIIYAAIGTNVSKWENNGWIPLGKDTNALNADSYIYSLTTDPAGNVYAAGWFTDDAGFCYVAKWNGAKWIPLGTGSNALKAGGPIYSITSDAAGNIYAAGIFFSSTGKLYVAKWNGTNWSEVGTGPNALIASGKIGAITTDAAGNVYAAVSYQNTTSYVTKFNGTSWAVQGTNSNIFNGDINTIALDAAGNLMAAGQLKNTDGKFYVARLNGSTWSEMGTGTNALNANVAIKCIITDAANNIYAGGYFYTPNTGKTYVSKWNGIKWSDVGTGTNGLNGSDGIFNLVFDSAGKLYAGGDFKNALNYRYVAMWDGVTWSEAGVGGVGTLSGANESIAVTKNADTVLVSGVSNDNNGNNVNVLFQWNGNVWKNIAVNSPEIAVTRMVQSRSGVLYGAASDVSNFHKGFIAKFNGGTWQDLGSSKTILNMFSDETKIALDSSGNLYATGYFKNSSGKFYVAKWNGSNWSEVGVGTNGLNADEVVTAMAVDKAGTIYVCAYKYFDFGIYKWTGTTWVNMTTNADDIPLNSINAIAVDGLGNVYTTFSSWNGDALKKWDGVSWKILGGLNSGVLDMIVDQKNVLYVNIQNRVKRFNGTNFTTIGESTSGELWVGSSMYFDAQGNLYSRAKHAGTDKTYFAKYDALSLLRPTIVNVADKCTIASTTKGKLANPPATGTVAITQDGAPLTYNAADSSFTYFTNGTTALGNHLIIAKYLINGNTLADTASFKVSNTLTPVISISSPDTVVCPNTFFTVTCHSNIPGATYQWYLDDWPCIQNCNDSTLTLTLTTSTLQLNIYCKVALPSAQCFTTYNISSNRLNFKQGTATPTVSIASDDADNTICNGQRVTFIASALHAGSNPFYQWSVNAVVKGTNAASFTTYDLNDNDQVQVVVTSSAGCSGTPTATSNIVTIKHWPASWGKLDSAKTICAGASTAIAIGVPSVNGYSYAWTSEPVGFVSILSNPLLLPSATTLYKLRQTNIASGCTDSSAIKINVSADCGANGITVGPNPANHQIVIQLDVNDPEPKYFDLFNSAGTLVLHKLLNFTTNINTDNFISGIYYYKITAGFGTVLKSGTIIIQH